MTAEPLLKLAAKLLAKHRLDAVLIGNAAAALNGAPVTTMDLDFFMRATPGNVRKVWLIAQDLEVPVTRPFYPASELYRIVRARDDLQFDFMVQIAGVRSYEGVRSRSTIVKFAGKPLRVASLRDVIRSKTAANRLEDRAVLPVLRRTVKERKRLYVAARVRNG
jgi:NAD(P)-dependent dehydrogenase (short-subunit alcohol dehydrogenase family)